ncbi:MAG: hypothetical protein LBP63_03010 [Prevotellaceae bacterium]|jgi:hypothetical protein|nr:hypothetical protein [Prevotellaceae bacterium]
MKKILLLTLFGLFTVIVTAQIVTDELPYGLKEDSITVKQQDVIILSAPDRALIAKEDSVNDSQPGAVRYAYPTKVNGTLNFAHIPAGAYIFRISQSNGESEEHKIQLSN